MELMELKKESALAAFVDKDGLDPLINEVERMVDEFDHDLSTAVGRKKTASLAAKISKFKVKIDLMGKDLVSDWKEKAKTVDSSRKNLRDSLDALRDRAREPLTAWEKSEKDRIARIQEDIEGIKAISPDGGFEDSDSCRERINDIKAVVIGDQYEEFATQAYIAKEETLITLEAMLCSIVKREDEKKELDRLRLEAEERSKADAEERLRKEGEERARKEAEDKRFADQEAARLAMEEAERKSKAEIEAVEFAKNEAIEQAKKAEADLMQSIEDEKKAVEQAELRHQKELIEASEKALREVEEAAKRATEEEELRKANAKHRQALKTTSKLAMMGAGLSESDAVTVIMAICSGKIPNISMRF